MLNAQFSHPPQFPPARNHPTHNSPTVRAWRSAVDNHGPAWPEPRRGSWGSTGYLPTPPSSFDYSHERSTLPHKPDSDRTDMNGYYNHVQEPVSHNTGSYNASNKSSRPEIGASASVPPASSHLSQPSYKSSRPTSTVPSRVASPVFESYPSRRGSANDGIHPYLQLPPTISPSGGSVTEFAAQITCLFWFESFTALSRTEDITVSPPPRSYLAADAVPTTGFLKWVTTILSTTQVTQNVVLLALLFIRRLKNQNPTVKGKPGSEYRLLTVALMLGNKFLDDNTYTNKTWAEVSGISVGEIHVMEVEFLSHMKYNLYTSREEWDHWHRQLGHLWQFFNPPSPVLGNGRPKQYGSRPPTIQIPRPLPSPPASANAYSPMALPYSPGLPPYSSAPMLPHLAPPQISPPQSLPGLESTLPSSRKRSWDDAAVNSVEPPAKRFHPLEQYTTRTPTHNVEQYTPRTTTPTRPAVPPDNYPRLPSLPMPNLAYSSSQSMTQSYPATTMPNTNNSTPTRSLPSFNWSQAALQNSQNLPPTALQNPSSGVANQSSRQATPYSAVSAHPSPIPTAFPSSAAHTTTQHQLSPSYFLRQRTSPYRPVRSISTLLVPPASGQLQNLPQETSHHHMRWQPLGRQGEAQTGRVPYLHREAWPQTHQWDQWPSQMPINMRG